MLRPIAIGIEQQPSASTAQLYRAPRWWGWERNRWAVAANPRRPGSIAELKEALGGQPNLDAHMVEDLLLDSLRTLATDPTAGVGADYLSIRISPYERPLVHIRYLPSSLEDGTPLYTGWVVTPGIVHPPQVATDGGLSVHSGWMTIEYEGPTNRGPTFTLSDQRRG